MKVQRLSLPFICLVLILLVSPLYTHPNIGGLGLAMPYNISSWLTVVILIFIVFIKIIRKGEVKYNNYFICCLIFPSIIILSSLFTDIPQADIWFFRLSYLLGGFVFLFALLQTNFSIKKIETVLFYMVISTLLHSIVGIIQIEDIQLFNDLLPPSKEFLPVGIFQQVNLLATYLATGCVIVIYLISRPSFNSASLFTKALFIISFGIALYVILSTGSRIGILSFILAVSLIVIVRRQQLFRHKYVVAALFVVATLAVFSGQSGFLKAVGKAELLTKGEYASARQTMYSTAVELIRTQPYFGYGIGSFPRVWADQTAKFAAAHPEAALPPITTSHPHNEILFWMIEGGFITVMGLISIFIAICLAISSCGISRGGAYLALLLPISLHTQVELPFYISSVHWFLFLFLIFIIFQHRLYRTKFYITKSFRGFIYTVISGVTFASVSLLLHAEYAQKSIYNYMYEEGENIQAGVSNPYFNRFSEKIVMQSLLYKSIDNADTSKALVFISWAEEAIQYNPELGMFILLTDAYRLSQDENSMYNAAKRGLDIYPNSERLQQVLGIHKN